jgi:hypothetical protein
MAIATLSELYNNHDVFTGVVKIRKGLAARMILDSNTVDGMYKWFYLMADNIKSRVPHDDPNSSRTIRICDYIVNITYLKGSNAINTAYWSYISLITPFVALFAGYNFYHEMTSRNLKLELSSLYVYEAAVAAAYVIFAVVMIAGSVRFVYFVDKMPKADSITTKLKFN